MVGKEIEQDFPLQIIISQIYLYSAFTTFRLCDRPDWSACSHCLVPIGDPPPDLTSDWAQNKK